MSKVNRLARFALLFTGSGASAYHGFNFLEGNLGLLPQEYFIPEIVQGAGGFLAGAVGNGIIRGFLPNTRPDVSEAYSLAALASFAHCDNDVRGVSTDESLQNISKSISQIIVTYDDNSSKGHKGSALMLTSDWYGMTAYHVLEALKDDGTTGKVVLNGVSRKIDKSSIVYDDSNDVAIFKAKSFQGFSKPLRARINPSPVKMGEEVRVLGIRDGQQYNSIGTIVSTSANVRTGGGTRISDSFLTDVRAVPGQSGGVIVNRQGEVIGVPAYIVNNGHDVGYVGGAKVKYALECIDGVIENAAERFFAFK